MGTDEGRVEGPEIRTIYPAGVSLKDSEDGADRVSASSDLEELRMDTAESSEAMETPATGLLRSLGGLLARRKREAAAAEADWLEASTAEQWTEFHRELSRSRRYERRFVLIRVSFTEPGGNGSAPASRSNARASAERLRRVGAFLRSVDRAWAAEDGIYVLLPETSREMGSAFLARMRQVAPEVLPVRSVTLAAFPEDGLTSGALLAAVRGVPMAGAPGRETDPDRLVEGAANVRPIVKRALDGTDA
jgi:hypothetical protein